ncbi:Translin family protein [Ophiocordyceps camponoti-floridani]|uniref:Translin family protein n=1 Tax=Ophiocordyceps camponoti-floridani TaxID=2030778 RepID=A0A8H4Q233_9HYPO|nr:Translin family protein [Ophiocordyceps camponoti-floridani]
MMTTTTQAQTQQQQQQQQQQQEILTSLSEKLDAETSTREALAGAAARLERGLGPRGGPGWGALYGSRGLPPLLAKTTSLITTDVLPAIRDLQALASPHPYYKYNSLWNKPLQSAITLILTCAWLGSYPPIPPRPPPPPPKSPPCSPSPRIPEASFHLTLEDYLSALPDLSAELARLAPNAVVLGDVRLPLLIATFVKDLAAGFQLLNLRNDGLRRKADALKYHVKRVEDVVYDLSLRGLVGKDEGEDKGEVDVDKGEVDVAMK